MNESGSLCPSIKAADIIGDKWILLILREMFLGATRYNDFQRALPRISPTILSKRLKQLEANGLIIKKTTAGQKTSEYRLTKCGRELAPLTDQMAKWGLRWARRRLSEEDFEVGGFMWDFHRTLKIDELPDGEVVFCINFPELAANKTWWVVVNGKVVDLCTDDPGKDVDLFITGSLPALAEVWMGDETFSNANQSGAIVLTGASHLTKTASHWFPKSRYADVKRAQ